MYLKPPLNNILSEIKQYNQLNVVTSSKITGEDKIIEQKLSDNRSLFARLTNLHYYLTAKVSKINWII